MWDDEDTEASISIRGVNKLFYIDPWREMTVVEAM